MELEPLLRETGALLSGHFRLSSGLHSGGYVQCARLLRHPRHAGTIGSELASRVAELRPEVIVAPALGGLIIGYAVAAALDIPMIFTERKDGMMVLRRGFEIERGSRSVIIEDVVTTGKSTRETAEVILRHGGAVAGYGSILNRSGTASPFEEPYRALLALDLETWSEEDCPLCADGVALDSPGSRFSGGR